MNTDISTKYDSILKTELESRLNRKASVNEIINADKDADLVNETLWQLICDINIRLLAVEKIKSK